MGDPAPVASGVAMESLFGMVHASSSTAGLMAYVPGGDLSVGKLAWVDRRGAVEYLDVPERVYGVVDLAPDGKRVAVHVADVKDYTWIYDLARQGGQRLANPEHEGFPRWSHDGRRLATYRRTTPRAVLVREVDSGIGDAVKLEGASGVPSSWSPHGDVLAVSEYGGRVGFIGLGNTLTVASLQGVFPTFSPDGQWLAYSSTQTGAGEIFIRSYPAGRVIGQVSVGGGIEPRWKASGELFFRHGNHWFSTQVSTTPEPHWDPPRLVFNTDFIDTPGMSYDVSPDGQRLLVVKRAHPVTQSGIEIVANWIDGLSREDDRTIANIRGLPK